MGCPRFTLNRLRVLRQGRVAYDQEFHEGVNIIRGENGSGKSTIADFIFYALGGEFDSWKDAAARCDEVQAEVLTNHGKLTLLREIGNKTTPIKVFFGPFDQADKHALDGWESFPIRRSDKRESFSQVLFRSLNIPEAQSVGASNITMHQVMRLLYSDQRTPSTRLFRFESFDKQDIREAVGDLICGISGYEIYEINLQLRDLDAEFAKVSQRLSSLIQALPRDVQLDRPDTIHSQCRLLDEEKLLAHREIENVDTLVSQGETKEFLKARQSAQQSLFKEKKAIASLEESIEKHELELGELTKYQAFLAENIEQVRVAESTFQAIGAIEFTRCPACLSHLQSVFDPHVCNVCGQNTDPEEDKSKYNQVRLDLEIQLRESKQLFSEHETRLTKDRVELRRVKRSYSKKLSAYSIKFDLSSSPREAFLAERYQRVGQIDQELIHLTDMLSVAEEVQSLSQQKQTMQRQITDLSDRRKVLEIQAQSRRSSAINAVSDWGRLLLRSDLDRQPEFKNPDLVELNFRDDAMFVDGQMNFAESSNVFLKNTAIFSLFMAAGGDELFNHPRFILLDNVEDKGMEVERSHLFQRLIVEHSTELSERHQIIYTTSMMNPELELDDYVIGPHYTHDKRTLRLKG
ncbi:hypothetical protein IDSA_06835 [Pseudidiomarina salinarum]|uniref:Rad50/SbcC-type AAA domain-containing protein n=1 Tax=Pseudidiomarina salinarum TaxID=435908 RepID=A0A094IYC1_9GAMM|nr:AAA family ATPase [Pseudidiomarina salinarum]KFZ30799.1 hypothetical protein IDSA_06835 [Pseudidiomarina salinarum]RUO71267.1 hypothetical protein CWI79_07520 [Pseudidiomarina salinarum]